MRKWVTTEWHLLKPLPPPHRPPRPKGGLSPAHFMRRGGSQKCGARSHGPFPCDSGGRTGWGQECAGRVRAQPLSKCHSVTTRLRLEISFLSLGIGIYTSPLDSPFPPCGGRSGWGEGVTGCVGHTRASPPPWPSPIKGEGKNASVQVLMSAHRRRMSPFQRYSHSNDWP